MRRAILWIIVIMTTFMIGVGIDRAVEHFLTSEIPKPAEPVAIYLPDPESEMTRAVTSMTPIAPVKPNLILDYDVDKIARIGGLYIMGSPVEGFEDFYCIAMSLGAEGHVDYPGYITVYTGMDETGDMADASFALVTERRLYFTTKPSDEHGFEYRFEGEFLVKDFAAVEGKNKAVVRGTLTKFRNGRKLAEQTLTFRMKYLEGC